MIRGDRSGLRARSLLIGGLVLTVALLAAARPAGAAPAPLLLGFTDPEAFQTRADWRPAALANAVRARASVARVFAVWSEVAPQGPPDSASARDPTWPGYRWDALDALLRDIQRAGLMPLVDVYGAPQWAEGPGRPRSRRVAPPGTWRPSATAFRDFSEAIARRYDGTFPDPAQLGTTLPRVHYWQGWNEPNLTISLSPQWRRAGRGWARVSPGIYRALQNAFYDGVKAANPRSLVIAAGLAPFGDPNPGDPRMAPAAFARSLMCVTGRSHPRAHRCPGGPVKLDAIAAHPYPVGSPRRRSINPDDISIPDMGKITRPLRVAVRAGNVVPRSSKQLWATEMSWDSRPPDPRALPAQLQAHYLEGALYTLWQQGARAVIWWQVRDSPRGRSYIYTLQSGIFFRGATPAQDRPKPSFEAFSFPFTAYRSFVRRRGSHGPAHLWGIAPHAGTVLIQRRAGSRWVTIRRLRAGSNRVFRADLRARHRDLLRAVQDAEASLSWRVA